MTHAMSVLGTRLPAATPSVYRAFGVHFAERHRTYRKLVDEIGHGRFPIDLEGLLDCPADEAHVLIVDEIGRGELLGYQVPVPDGVSSDLEIRVTLSYLSPVEPSEVTEYTRAALEMVLRPHEMIHSIRPPKDSKEGKAQTLDYTSPEARKLFELGWEMSQEPVAKSLGAPPGSSEAKLRESGKWETVRHHRMNVAAGEVLNPRLALGYVARRAGSIDNSPTTVPFAILVSIIDKDGAGDLHDKVDSQFSRLQQLSTVPVRVGANAALVQGHS